MASSIVEVESKMAPTGEVTLRGGSTSRRIDGTVREEDRSSRRTISVLGRFAAALTAHLRVPPRAHPRVHPWRSEPLLRQQPSEAL